MLSTNVVHLKLTGLHNIINRSRVQFLGCTKKKNKKSNGINKISKPKRTYFYHASKFCQGELVMNVFSSYSTLLLTLSSKNISQLLELIKLVD